MKTSRQSLGRWGEALAARYLSGCGYTILDKNARTPYGEIDLVARQASPDAGPEAACLVTVFVEVKTRTSTAFGMPEEAVTARKRAHLLQSAQAYLESHPELEGDWRVDVIAIQRFPFGKPAEITHFENAVN